MPDSQIDHRHNHPLDPVDAVAPAIELETPRLRLRQWRESDREPFAAMNADPSVMAYFAAVQSRAASDASIDAWRSQFASRGWSNWAVELQTSGQFIGFVGLSVPRRTLPFTPCVEIGWRLAREHWGKGYATEAARAALQLGFERLALPEIVSFTAVVNRRSRAVMERIGMCDARQDFEHPAFPDGHPLRLHCLYRITLAEWGDSNQGPGIAFRAAQAADGPTLAELRVEALLLDRLYVHPLHQGRGIGAAVLAQVVVEADAAGVPVRVGALRESASNRFYARHGFVEVEQGEFDNYYVRIHRRMQDLHR